MMNAQFSVNADVAPKFGPLAELVYAVKVLVRQLLINNPDDLTRAAQRIRQHPHHKGCAHAVCQMDAALLHALAAKTDDGGLKLTGLTSSVYEDGCWLVNALHAICSAENCAVESKGSTKVSGDLLAQIHRGIASQQTSTADQLQTSPMSGYVRVDLMVQLSG